MREKILNLSPITSDLNTKVKVLENERDSLIVALKLQQKEFEQGQITKEKSPGGNIGKWQTIGAAQQKLDKTHEDHIPTNLNLSNSFETLNDEMCEEHDQQNLGNGNDTDISQQPASGHQCNTDSKAAAGLRESSKATPSDEQTYNGSQESKQGIVIIGDSIVKHINPTKLLKKKMHKFKYPSKTASGINNELSSINIHTTPSHVIVHAGTNNIPVQSAEECINEIEKLIVSVKRKFPNSRAGISGITPRQDIDSTSKIREVNEKGSSKFQKFC